jgi:hypothetical protein
VEPISVSVCVKFDEVVLDPTWYRNGSRLVGITETPEVFAPTVSITAMPIESGVLVLITWSSPKYVPAARAAGFTPTSSVAVLLDEMLPLEV